MKDVNWHVEVITREVFTDNYIEMCREKENTIAYTWALTALYSLVAKLNRKSWCTQFLYFIFKIVHNY